MKKLQLSENLFDTKRTKLEEAFSDSMPDWLRANILDTIVRSKPANIRQKQYDKYSKNYDLAGLKGGKHYGRSSWVDIKQGMDNAGIDLTRANFIHGEPPTKSTDPRLKAPNQAFILIEYDGKQQVYAPGLNETEITIFPIADKYASVNTFKYARFSDYKPYIKDFYYVNTADPENINTDLKNARRENELALRGLQNASMERVPEKQRNRYPYNYQKYDKSGYLINPERYKDALRQAQKMNYAKKLQTSYNRLQAIKDALVNYIMEADAADKESLRFASDVLRGRLEDAIEYYNRVANLIRNNERQYDPTSPEFSRFLDSLFSPYSDVYYMDEYIDRAEQAVSKITFVDFDW